MKKLFMFLLLLTLASCQDDPITPTNLVSTTEQGYLGDWKLDSTQMYINAAYVGTNTFNDPINCHLDLKAEIDNIQTTGNYKNATNGFTSGCVNIDSYWKLQSALVIIIGGSPFSVNSLTSTKLVIQSGNTTNPSGTANIYYFTKL